MFGFVIAMIHLLFFVLRAVVRALARFLLTCCPPKRQALDHLIWRKEDAEKRFRGQRPHAPLGNERDGTVGPP